MSQRMPRDSIQQAVLFADISGSSALYTTLGDRAALQVVDSFIDLGERVARDCRGLMIKSVGDAALCLFPTADAALLAASALLEEVSSRPIAGHELRVHAGFSFGTVVAENGDVFGDTVNVAAYLANMATAEQILTTETTQQMLSAPLRERSRPIFRARVKGSNEDTTVCEVLWRPDPSLATDINPNALHFLPPDEGGLVLEWEGGSMRIDHSCAQALIGRGTHCDVVVNSRYASREHALIKAEGATFFLEDRSTNGTLIVFDDGNTLNAFRREIPLEGSGQILIGSITNDANAARIRFVRDRRSYYRF